MVITEWKDTILTQDITEKYAEWMRVVDINTFPSTYKATPKVTLKASTEA
ncbi:MAG: hypothetical protein ACRCUJ_13050 [Phocaeicola sp.]